MSGMLSQFEVVENEGDEYLAMFQVRSICVSVSLEDGLYVPSVSDDEYGECCAKGQGMRTPELAADAALVLVQGHLRAMSRAFMPLGSDVIEVAK